MRFSVDGRPVSGAVFVAVLTATWLTMALVAVMTTIMVDAIWTGPPQFKWLGWGMLAYVGTTVAGDALTKLIDRALR